MQKILLLLLFSKERSASLPPSTAAVPHAVMRQDYCCNSSRRPRSAGGWRTTESRRWCIRCNEMDKITWPVAGSLLGGVWSPMSAPLVEGRWRPRTKLRKADFDMFRHKNSRAKKKSRSLVSNPAPSPWPGASHSGSPGCLMKGAGRPGGTLLGLPWLEGQRLGTQHHATGGDFFPALWALFWGPCAAASFFC